MIKLTQEQSKILTINNNSIQIIDPEFINLFNSDSVCRTEKNNFILKLNSYLNELISNEMIRNLCFIINEYNLKFKTKQFKHYDEQYYLDLPLNEGQ